MIASLCLLASLAVAADPAPVSLAVLDFQASGASPELTAAAQGVVAHELEALGTFRVTTGEAVRALVDIERQRALLGCEGEACSVPFQQALNANYVVGGKLSKVGEPGAVRWTLELTLLDVAKGARDGSYVGAAQSEAALLSEAAHGATQVVQKLLAVRSGGFIVSASEAGAVVKVDDVAVGSTPLNGMLTLPGGPHRLLVEKDSFVAYRKDIRVESGHTSEEHVVMVPSPDFIAQHRERSGKLRLGAWAASGLAVAMLGTGIAFQLGAQTKYGSVTTPNTFLYDRAQLQNGDESYRASTSHLQSVVSTEQTLSAVSFAVSAAAVAGAAFLWISGDDPGRYDKFQPLHAVVVPAPGGALASFGVAF